MKGTVLDFSIQTNSGLISGEDGQRYTFIGSEWKEQNAPLRGDKVDFATNEALEALAIYYDVYSAQTIMPSAPVSVPTPTPVADTPTQSAPAFGRGH